MVPPHLLDSHFPGLLLRCSGQNDGSSDVRGREVDILEEAGNHLRNAWQGRFPMQAAHAWHLQGLKRRMTKPEAGWPAWRHDECCSGRLCSAFDQQRAQQGVRSACQLQSFSSGSQRAGTAAHRRLDSCSLS